MSHRPSEGGIKVANESVGEGENNDSRNFTFSFFLVSKKKGKIILEIKN